VIVIEEHIIRHDSSASVSDTPRVSVVVPVYNVEVFLEKCLTSLVSQTLDELEVLVVNDGSPDESQSIIDRFVEAYPGRIRSLVKPNGGLSDARNYGIAHATGEYIGFVDGDDYVHSEMFDLLQKKACETDADIVVCGYEGVDLITGKTVYHMQGLESDYGRPLSASPRTMLASAPYAWNKIYRRRLFEDSGVRYPVGKLFEDIPVTYALFALANRIEKVQRPLYYYMQSREGAITHSYSPRNIEIFDTLRLLGNFYQEQGIFEQYRSVLLELHFRHIFNRFRELPRYEGMVVKRLFLSRGWSHLDEFFPDWRENEVLREKYKNNFRFLSFRHSLLGYAYALAPTPLHRGGEKSSALAKRSYRRYRKNINAWFRRKPYVDSLSQLPVNPGIALFESFHGKNISDSPFYLMRELHARGSHEIYVGVLDVEGARRFLSDHDLSVTPIRMYSREYLHLMATAGILVNNVSFPDYFSKRPEQAYLNTWHGTPLKTLGKAMPHGMSALPNIQRNFLKADILLFTNAFTRECMMRDYMLEDVYAGEAVVMGSPRNAALFDTVQREEVRSTVDWGSKRVYLYMPTWRGGGTGKLSIGKYRETALQHLRLLDQALDDEAIVLVKFHSLVSEHISLEELEHIRLAPADFETYELLNLVDVLITDYSSVMFDFVATGREVLLFDYDREEYTGTRGFYFDFASLPFPSFQTPEALASHIHTRRSFIATPEYSDFAHRYTSLDSALAPRHLLDRLLKKSSELIEHAANTEWDVGPEVDVVFATGLATKAGQARFLELLDSGYERKDVLFVFSQGRNIAVAHEFISQLERDRPCRINYIIVTGKMLFSLSQLWALGAERLLGKDSAALKIAFSAEVRRLFGNVRIRSAYSSSQYRRFGELANFIETTVNR